MSALKSFGLDRLSLAERILLVEDLWDSIEEEAAQLPLSDEQQEDLKRRLVAYETNPKSGSTWEQVKARLQRRS